MDQVGGRQLGIKDFDPGHSSCPLIDLIAWFLGSTVSKSGLYCQLHSCQKKFMVVVDPHTLPSWVGSVLCLCPELQLLFHSQKSSWWLGVQTASSRYVFFQVGQHLTLPAITVGLEVQGTPSQIQNPPTSSQPCWVGPPAQRCFLAHSLSFPLSSDPCCFSPGWATHTHCSAKLIQLSVCQYTATVPFGPTGVLLISHSWAAC